MEARGNKMLNSELKEENEFSVASFCFEMKVIADGGKGWGK